MPSLADIIAKIQTETVMSEKKVKIEAYTRSELKKARKEALVSPSPVCTKCQSHRHFCTCIKQQRAVDTRVASRYEEDEYEYEDEYDSDIA